MIEKVITIASLDEDTSQQDLAYWLSRPSEERLVARSTIEGASV